MEEPVVGVLRENGRDGLVFPERPSGAGPVFIARRDLNGAPFGMKVVVELLYRPDEDPADGIPRRRPRATEAELATGSGLARGRVVETLGDPASPDVAMVGILRAYGLEEHFPDSVMREVESIGTDPSPEEIAREIARGRRDLRGMSMVTIDGADAKDLDDAVSVEMRRDGGFRLGVHIADVSWYVREGTALDAEARQRGTSVYPPGRVVPMLPPRLSNGLCSLNPQRPRFAFTCLMDLSPEGEPIGHEIFESLIQTRERMTYDDVFTLLDAPEGEAGELRERYADLLPDFRRMRELAAVLRRRRTARGAMDFDFPETKVLLDAQGLPVDIHPYRVTFANGIVEEFMILCNETVAEHFLRLGSPFAYRVHEPPDPERLHRFSVIAANFGQRHRFQADGAAAPGQLARILEEVKGQPYGPLLSRILLRSLAKARYAPECLGHYGLASRFYCHFTSPIRRYPDLFIHRVMKVWLQEAPAAKPGTMPRGLSLRLAPFRASAEAVCLRSSFTERRAEQAERDVVSLKAAQFMARHLGEEFDGIVSGIVPAGFFVVLDSTVEGMVAFATLEDYFDYDEDAFVATGRRTGETFHIGDRVLIQVARSEPETRRIDFLLQERLGTPVGQGRKGAAKAPRARTTVKARARGKGKGRTGAKGRKARPAGRTSPKRRR